MQLVNSLNSTSTVRVGQWLRSAENSTVLDDTCFPLVFHVAVPIAPVPTRTRRVYQHGAVVLMIHRNVQYTVQSCLLLTVVVFVPQASNKCTFSQLRVYSMFLGMMPSGICTRR